MVGALHISRRKLAAVSLAPIALYLHSCSAPSSHTVTIGIQVSPAMTLVMVAKDGGFFQREGLSVELKQFTAGKFALQAFLSGAIDYAVSGEVPVALATLQGNQTRVVAQVVESTVNEVRMVARRDDGLTDPAQYFSAKRRKLATSFGGGPEFYTYSFLKHYAIPVSSVEIISQKPEDMPAALATGSVDAVAIFEPFAYFAEKRAAGQEIVFSDPSLYSELYVLNARPEQIEKSPKTLAAVVRALVNAGAAIAADPESAKQTMQRYTKLDRAVVDAIWASFVFRPALTQKLLDDWAAEAAWAKDTGKIPAGSTAPDFHAILAPRFLKKANPAMVRYESPQQP
jgi:ABC-type nitrate/sulfonate/bicarbonate transport system substrate-binding protein